MDTGGGWGPRGTFHFCLRLLGHDLITWTHLPAREAGKWSFHSSMDPPKCQGFWSQGNRFWGQLAAVCWTSFSLSEFLVRFCFLLVYFLKTPTHTCGGAIIFSLSELLPVTSEFEAPQTRNSARGVPYLPGLEGPRTRSASTGPPARRPSGAGPQVPAGCFTHFLHKVLPSTLPGAEPVRVGAPEPM